MRQFIFAVVGCLICVSLLTAQFKVDVALVTLVATVIDERGRYVPDLKPEDFILQEDGQPQEIVHLTQSFDTPVSMGIVLDTSGSMERKIATATDAVERFIEATHRDDEIFLMTFSDRPSLRQDFTSNRSRLGAALRRIRVGGGTAMYDALDESLDKIQEGHHPKKSILLISDGQDTSSASTYEDALRDVRESELLVYALGISPSGGSMTERIPVPTGGGGGIGFPRFPGTPPTFPGGGGRRDPRLPPASRGPFEDSVDMRILKGLADASGGRAFLLSGAWSDSRGNQMELALDEIASELRNQYNIGYYPQHPVKDGKWHRIDIRTRNKSYFVRAKKDYFGN
jgi:VWFA-related protein